MNFFEVFLEKDVTCVITSALGQAHHVWVGYVENMDQGLPIWGDLILQDMKVVEGSGLNLKFKLTAPYNFP